MGSGELAEILVCNRHAQLLYFFHFSRVQWWWINSAECKLVSTWVDKPGTRKLLPHVLQPKLATRELDHDFRCPTCCNSPPLEVVLSSHSCVYKNHMNFSRTLSSNPCTSSAMFRVLVTALAIFSLAHGAVAKPAPKPTQNVARDAALCARTAPSAFDPSC